jgi:hypothetical protein
MYDDLIILQEILANHIPFIGSLRYDEWRMCINLVDGDLLALFTGMEEGEQRGIVEEYVRMREVEFDEVMMECKGMSVEESLEWFCGVIERLDSITRS